MQARCIRRLGARSAMEILPSKLSILMRVAATKSQLLAALFLLLIRERGLVEAQSTPFPAYFIFGDSLVDAGNNNYITTVAKASNLPFGIDFPQGPTGRFTNGKTVTDVVSELINLPFPPPYLAPTTRGPAILQGVNYASAAAGIIRSTGYNFIGRVDFDTQLNWFTNTIEELKQQLGEFGAKDLIGRSFFSTALGANDYVNNYLLKGSPLPLKYNPQQFQELLLNKFNEQLTRLYNLGAKNVSVSSIGPIGCIPSQLARRSVNGECSAFVNSFALNFNAGLKVLIQQLNSQLTGSNFVYAESYDPVFAFRSNPQQYGFKFGAQACCGGGRFNGVILCLPIVKPCPDRDDYVFFDAYHPTQAANLLLGRLLYDGLKNSFFSS